MVATAALTNIGTTLVSTSVVTNSIEISSATWHGIPVDYLFWFVLILVIAKR